MSYVFDTIKIESGEQEYEDLKDIPISCSM